MRKLPWKICISIILNILFFSAISGGALADSTSKIILEGTHNNQFFFEDTKLAPGISTVSRPIIIFNSGETPLKVEALIKFKLNNKHFSQKKLNEMLNLYEYKITQEDREKKEEVISDWISINNYESSFLKQLILNKKEKCKIFLHLRLKNKAGNEYQGMNLHSKINISSSQIVNTQNNGNKIQNNSLHLPNTATNVFLFLYLGIFLILVSFFPFTYFLRKKKLKKLL